MEEFFLKEGPRRELFNYEAFDPATVLGPIPEEQHYWLICNRYGSYESWEECTRSSLNYYSRSSRDAKIDLFHNARRVWEVLFYQARATCDERLMEQALEIFRPLTAAELPCRAGE